MTQQKTLTTSFQDVSALSGIRTFNMISTDAATSIVVEAGISADAETGVGVVPLGGKTVAKDRENGSCFLRYRLLAGTAPTSVWVDAAAIGPAGATGAAGDDGADATYLQDIQAALVVDGAGSTAIAETYLGTIAVAGLVDPWLAVRGTVTSDNSNYATITFKLYRAGSAVKTWTLTSQISGMGSLSSGQFVPKADPFACVAGDHMTYTQTKTGTGVVLPVRTVGASVTPA